MRFIRLTFLGITAFVLLTTVGCRTVPPPGDTPPAPQPSVEDRPIGEPEDQGEAEGGPITTPQPEASVTPGNAAALLSEPLEPAYTVVTVDERPVAGLYRSAVLAPDDPPRRPVLLGLFRAAETLTVVQAPVPTTATHPVTGPRSVRHVGVDTEIRLFENLTLDNRSSRSDRSHRVDVPNGFRVRLSGTDREEDLVVIAGPATPYIARTPFSSVNQTAFRDLDGDGLKEMVRTSRVFESGGRREVIVDAFRWDGTSFIPAASVSLVRRLNELLDHLQVRLREDTDPQWIRTASDAFTPLEGAGPVGELLALAESVNIPDIAELTVDVGLSVWEFAHDIAVDNSLYRLHIRLSANPLTTQPATIVGMQGL